MHCLSLVYYVNQSLHVWGIFITHYQEAHCIYTAIGMFCAFKLTICWPDWEGTGQFHPNTACWPASDGTGQFHPYPAC